MKVKNLSSIGIKNRLRILLLLLLVIPTLVLGYLISQYLIYIGVSMFDVFRLNLILILTFILSMSGFLLVKDLLNPFERITLWAREIQKGNVKADFFEKRDDEVGELFIFFEELAKKMRQDYEVVKELSITDELTGLYNYRYFHRRLSEEMERANRYKREFSLVMFDIDNFKIYNDTFGHLAGDSALKKVAEILKKQSRTSDIVARYGGEEFMAILPETSAGHALIYAERICKAISKETFSNQEKGLAKLTLSAGISQYLPYQEKGELISSVDKVLYSAKSNGRNQVVMNQGGGVTNMEQCIATPVRQSSLVDEAAG